MGILNRGLWVVGYGLWVVGDGNGKSEGKWKRVIVREEQMAEVEPAKANSPYIVHRNSYIVDRAS